MTLTPQGTHAAIQKALDTKYPEGLPKWLDEFPIAKSILYAVAYLVGRGEELANKLPDELTALDESQIMAILGFYYSYRISQGGSNKDDTANYPGQYNVPLHPLADQLQEILENSSLTGELENFMNLPYGALGIKIAGLMGLGLKIPSAESDKEKFLHAKGEFFYFIYNLNIGDIRATLSEFLFNEDNMASKPKEYLKKLGAFFMQHFYLSGEDAELLLRFIFDSEIHGEGKRKIKIPTGITIQKYLRKLLTEDEVKRRNIIVKSLKSLPNRLLLLIILDKAKEGDLNQISETEIKNIIKGLPMEVQQYLLGANIENVIKAYSSYKQLERP